MPTQDATEKRSNPQVNGVAYSGGAIRLPNFNAPVVVDLAGLIIPESVPLLANHENRTNSRVGIIKAQKIQNTLMISGEITADSFTAKNIVSQKGWQLSIGAEVLEAKHIRPGQSCTVNGQQHDGPFYHVTKSHLREVSVIPVGADVNTSLSIAAQLDNLQSIDTGWYIIGGYNLMSDIVSATESSINNDDNQSVIAASAQTDFEPQDVIKAERERVATIRDMCGFRTGLADKAVEAGWDVDHTSHQLLKEINAEKPKHYELSSERKGTRSRETKDDVLFASLCLKTGMEQVIAGYSDHILSQAKVNASRTALALAEYAVKMDVTNDYKYEQLDPEETVRAAFSSYLLPGILTDYSRRILLKSYAEAPTSWTAFANVQSVTDFREYRMHRMSAMKPLERVIRGGELAHGTLNEEIPICFNADTFGQMLAIDRRDIIDDDLNAFSNLAQGLGIAAARTLTDLVWKTILDNAGDHFSEANKNLMAGADSGLTIDALSRAITLLGTQRDSDGNDLDLRPHVLVVPPELERAARSILESDHVVTGVKTVLPTHNTLKHAVKLEVDSRISNTNKFKNASEKRWYLFAAPLHVPVVVAFLNGKKHPTIEALGMQADVSRLAYVWRVYHDFGVSLGDPKAAVLAIGE